MIFLLASQKQVLVTVKHRYSPMFGGNTQKYAGLGENEKRALSELGMKRGPAVCKMQYSRLPHNPYVSG
jgi:hypothetical protein